MDQPVSASQPVNVAVSGANGYIGTAVVDRLRGLGIRVRALSRQPSAAAQQWTPYDLRKPLTPDALDGVDALIHLAAETRRGPAADVSAETTATDRLIEACRAHNVRLVFVSSQASQPHAATAYGQAKWACERRVLAAAGIVVRPGQVYGGPEMGLYGTICQFLRKSPLIPRFWPEPGVQPVHLDDLADGLIACAIRPDVPAGIYEIAAERPLAFSAFLRQLADIRLKRRVFAVPVPMLAIATLARLSFLGPAVSGAAQRLASLASLPVMQTQDSLAALGLRLRSLPDGLALPGSSRRRLILEARTLLAYELRGLAPVSCVKRYVRAVEALYQGQALVLRPLFRQQPRMLAVVDQPKSRLRAAGDLFQQRLDLATVCAEASTAAARHFLIFDPAHRLRRLLALGIHMVGETCFQALGIAFGAALDRLRPRLAREPAE
ncbi:NAD-dependent epimerase/dehydratase family protein [Tardiphaga sp. vice278]|uniref:NAD-dependent epimerase/dehydratase family protein n=1 Tax=Tardiphaga sp. vice278 TaxID=2592815 RepID=UPI001164602E|nr:NAD-dependent epimerase/dehydratase family protein [Tardiphaga sp. vice278]QDM17954.1 NAD-dependent epimerase/dehydratase family protein [Tardiphaga sp. vice278]